MSMLEALGAQEDLGTERLRLLESSLLGDVPQLDRFVRHDVLDWAAEAVSAPVASRAADVLVAAAAPAYADGVTDHWRRLAVTGFLGAEIEHADETMPTGHARLDQLLAEVAAADIAAREAWRQAVTQMQVWTTRWAPAMHEATWALHLTDRLRLAADAQLAAVLAFRSGGFNAHDAAYGVWNALSGLVHATLADDLLADEHRARLTLVHRLVGTGPA
ncbi:hypothetical protein D9V37_13845 [Nocardioides mangrovicus]|uniref:Uncharacterized protein n=1 Tax=Nocardioides mangrovicus TaxID=2478913 RepID=A0A3L8P2L5_9ACTN|nr:hypothetical protein [Nocardioides mangrovicus]RLV48799.1 hypothetical protein D9V37_13845 [Nocardioides mangrovicus]